MSAVPHQRPRRDGQKAAHERDRLFVLRNWLNAIFILMAAISIGGVACAWIGDGPAPTWPTHLCVVAVIIKMVEVALRMPVMLHRKEGNDRRQRKAYTMDDFADRRQTTPETPDSPEIPEHLEKPDLPEIPEHPAAPQKPAPQQQD
ncbi:MAG: hypothetical protein MR624_05910 [Bacteroidales bacterium]|nr:hypothetical protein [Bacteroidales bacterium]